MKQNNLFLPTPPTLQDFHAELLRQPEHEAQELAFAIGLFTKGSLNIFAKPTTIKNYIKNQLQEATANDQISLKGFIDSFTGEPVKRG